ncbi:MAG: hypothetical protein AVDCRST_MAG59-843, partial [uncultured Thermomicrobiales bacterium]
ELSDEVGSPTDHRNGHRPPRLRRGGAKHGRIAQGDRQRRLRRFRRWPPRSGVVALVHVDRGLLARPRRVHPLVRAGDGTTPGQPRRRAPRRRRADDRGRTRFRRLAGRRGRGACPPRCPRRRPPPRPGRGTAAPRAPRL